MEIGFIGVGVMGSRMVKRLLLAGYAVTVYNRSPQKTEALISAGAKRAVDLISLAQSSDVICTCLSMPEDVIEVYLSPNGIIEFAKESAILIDFTTVDPDTSRQVFLKSAEKKLNYLDAPVSGGPEGAEAGSLTIMVGGNKSAFQDILPILNQLGKNIEFLGKVGSGSIAKLINQYLVAVHSIAASEAMVTGAAFGLNSEQLFRLLKVSYGDSRILQRHMDQFVLDRNFKPGGAVKYVYKDVHLANQLLKQAGIKEYLGQLAENSFAEAIEQGLADFDMSAIIQPLEKQCNVVVKK